MKLFTTAVTKSGRAAEMFTELDVRTMSKNLARSNINDMFRGAAATIIDFVDKDGEELTCITMEIRL